jgi:anti-sigma factor RsiW
MRERPRKKDIELELSRYADGRLSRRRARKLERRLATDPALREELRRYMALDGHLTAMADGGLAGVDYQAQRMRIVATLERRALLGSARRRPVVLRPVFWGSLAAAAALVAAVSVWVVTQRSARPTAEPGRGEIVSVTVEEKTGPTKVETAIVPVAETIEPGEVETVLRRLDLDEIRLSLWPPGEEAPDAPPPGTVVVSAGTAMPAETTGAFPFPVEMR